MIKLSQSEYDRLIHPTTCAPDDFWGQVRRTVNGKPVSQEQIDAIVCAIRAGLQLKQDDVLLDIGCGNGALASYLFDSVQAYLGVDISTSLIDVARKYFERAPSVRFSLQGASEYMVAEEHPSYFTKALCYGAFAYFSPSEAKDVLSAMHSRFSSVRTFFIGNLPDAEKADAFFAGRDALPLDDCTTAIGKWYARAEFTELASSCGWDVSYTVMPENFYGAHYRFDATLTRKVCND